MIRKHRFHWFLRLLGLCIAAVEADDTRPRRPPRPARKYRWVVSADTTTGADSLGRSKGYLPDNRATSGTDVAPVVPSSATDRATLSRAQMARPRPTKKRPKAKPVQPPLPGMPPPDPPGTSRVLPMLLRIGDRLTDETGVYEIIGRPYRQTRGRTCTSACGESITPKSQRSGCTPRMSASR